MAATSIGGAASLRLPPQSLLPRLSYISRSRLQPWNRHESTRTGPPSKSNEDPNLVASQTAVKVYPPPSMYINPRPKVSRSSHRTSQPTKARDYPDKHSPRSRIPLEKLGESECAPNLPYFVTRTPSDELPIYELSKGGESKHITRIKHIDGNVEAFREALQKALGLERKECIIRPLNKHIHVKGHLRAQVEAFLAARNF